MPKRLSALVRLSGVLRYLLIGVAGWLTLTVTPSSIERIYDNSDAAFTWSLLLIIGPTLSIIGSLWSRPLLESGGCGITAGGFTIWTAAALQQPEVDRVVLAVAAVFAGGAVGQLQQAFIIATGAFDRRRR